MYLHPSEAVEAFSERNREGLSILHACISTAVAEAFAQFEPRHPDGLVHGAVFSAVVRDIVLVELSKRSMVANTLQAAEGAFRSVRLMDAQGLECRVHLHPRDFQSRRYIPVTEPSSMSLFGFVRPDFELTILWVPSRKHKGLRNAYLAAVSDIDDRTRTLVFARAALPPVSVDDLWLPEVTEDFSQVEDDFDDFFEEGEEFGGTTPA